MSNWITKRRARFALALCLAVWPAWQTLSTPDPASPPRAGSLLRSATDWFAPSGHPRAPSSQLKPVPLGLRN